MRFSFFKIKDFYLFFVLLLAIKFLIGCKKYEIESGPLINVQLKDEALHFNSVNGIIPDKINLFSSLKEDFLDETDISKVIPYFRILDNNQKILEISDSVYKYATVGIYGSIKDDLNSYNPNMYWQIIKEVSIIPSSKYNNLLLEDLSNAIYIYWMDLVTMKLEYYYQKDINLKFDKDFNFLIQRCKEENYSLSMGMHNSEKVIFNFVNRKWKHLFYSSWYQTSVWEKALVFLATFIFITGLTTIYKKVFNLIIRKAK